MPRIFISYRRADSVTITGRIHDHLVTAFGAENVFKDVDDIPPGADFRQILEQEVGSCEVLLVIVGPTWVATQNAAGQPRLFDDDDFVRIEVAAGLSRPEVLVIPVLVKGAKMPSPADLPPDLQKLVYRNAATVRDDPDFNRDINRLINKIKEHKAALTASSHEPAVAPLQVKPASAGSTPPGTSKPTSRRRSILLWGIVVSVIVIIGFIISLQRGWWSEWVNRLPVSGSYDQIVCGGEVEGYLDDDTPAQEWPFPGQAGQSVLLTMSRIDADSSLDPFLSLTAPWGETIAEDNDMGHINNARVWTVLPDEGDYIAQAQRFENAPGTEGPYTLRLECDVPKLTCGAPEYGVITNEVPENRWVFEGFSTQSIRLEMVHTGADDQGRYVAAHMTLLGPGDELLAESHDDVNALLEYILPEDGLYSVIATRADPDNERQVGDYELTLFCE